MKRKGLNAMPALPKFLVLLAIILLARSGDTLMNLSSAFYFFFALMYLLIVQYCRGGFSPVMAVICPLREE
jgi:hypothetical protein